MPVGLHAESDAAPGRPECAVPTAGAAATVSGRRHVLHVVDTLDAGGKERVAVNLVNALPRERFRLSLCTTRRDGSLSALVADDVTRLRLERRWRFDLAAVLRTIAFVRRSGVELLHAHGSSLFHCRLVAAAPPYPAVLWHDHYGRETAERPVWMYRAATAGCAGVIAVNSRLADWARSALHVRADRVWYVPNFVVSAAGAERAAAPPLPGTPDTRIVCVAHLRPQKDHLTLIAAMAQVAAAMPEAHLVLVGELVDVAYVAAVRREIAARRLDGHVSILGLRQEVPAILRASAVGVLSSASEGLPLALIEYGKAGLAAVATDVGECRAVLDDGRAGVLVPPGNATALGTALLSVLRSGDLRRTLSDRLATHIDANFSESQGIRRMCEIYDLVLGHR